MRFCFLLFLVSFAYVATAQTEAIVAPKKAASGQPLKAGKPKPENKSKSLPFRIKINTDILMSQYKLDSITVDEHQRFLPAGPRYFDVAVYKAECEDSVMNDILTQTSNRFATHVLGDDTNKIQLTVTLVTNHITVNRFNDLSNLLYQLMDKDDKPAFVRERFEKMLSIPFRDIPSFEGLDVGVTVEDGVISFETTIKLAPDYKQWEPEVGRTRLGRLLFRGADTECNYKWKSLSHYFSGGGNAIVCTGKMTMKTIPIAED